MHTLETRHADQALGAIGSHYIQTHSIDRGGHSL